VSKLAIFVEGQTEAVFFKRLLREVAGASRGSIRVMEARGQTGHRSLYVLKSETINVGLPFYALIVDCAGDTTVLSDIRDQYAGLRAAGYTMILGLRDVYPLAHAEIQRLRAVLAAEVAALTGEPVPHVEMVLAIKEIEAWFIAEDTHFQRLDPTLTCARINADLGFDPCEIDVESLPHPVEALKRIYALVGRLYRKHKDEAEQTVDALDYDRLYVDTRARVPSLAHLLDRVDEFLAAGA
jgi:hypothetical protein